MRGQTSGPGVIRERYKGVETPTASAFLCSVHSAVACFENERAQHFLPDRGGSDLSDMLDSAGLISWCSHTIVAVV